MQEVISHVQNQFSVKLMGYPFMKYTTYLFKLCTLNSVFENFGAYTYVQCFLPIAEVFQNFTFFVTCQSSRFNGFTGREIFSQLLNIQCFILKKYYNKMWISELG